MFDLETLGTTADSVIMSIGAVKFNLETGEIDNAGFYASVSIDSNLEVKRRISEDTLIWWLKQSKEAQTVFGEEKQTLRVALESLADWLGTSDYTVWSNGADFDLPMLAHACSQFGMAAPWNFWNARCVRTYRALPGAKDVGVARTGTHHNALADAEYQARLVCAIHAKLFGKKAVKA